MTTIRRKHCRIIPDAGSAEKLSDLSLWPGSTTLVSSGCLQGPCSSQQTGSAGSRFAPRMTIRMPILTLRDLAKHFQTTTEARAHCCFGCFRRLLWPIGDRGVCWTSVDRNGWHTSTWRLLTYRMPFVTSYHKNDQTCINHYTFTVHSQNRAKQCETNNMWDSSFKTQKTCTTWKDRPEFEFSCHKLIL